MDSQATPDVVIPLSKAKVVLLLLGASAFVAACVWIWSLADTQARFDPLVMQAVAVAGVSFFGLCALYACVKAFDTRTGRCPS